MNRRALLAGAAGSMLTVLPATGGLTVTGIPSPDADLIAACSEYLRIEWALDTYYATLQGDMEADDPGWAIVEPIPALAEQIVAMRATTAEGFLARALCRAFHYMPRNPACSDDPEAGYEDRFDAAELRDLVQMQRGAPQAAGQPLPRLPDPTSPDHPDAALFAACARAVAVWDTIESMPAGQFDEVWDALGERWGNAIEPVINLRARTRIGCKAKARVLVLYMEGDRPGEGDQERRFAWRLAHDVLLGAMV